MQSRKQPDILIDYSDSINYSAILETRAEADARLGREHWREVRELLASLPTAAELRGRGITLQTELDSPAVVIGRAGDLDAAEAERLEQLVQRLIPWRKGPFNLFGRAIDSEWRSDWKWERLKPALNLRGKRVADVGCGNGYYMCRALHMEPECLIGIDPSEAFYFAFQLLQRYLEEPRARYEIAGAEELRFFPEFFDVILCLGVIYHQRNPLELLQQLHRAMRPGAELILESQAVPGDGPWSLTPPDRYAKARNVWFLPTADCLMAWLARCGFRDIELISTVTVTVEEQRRTELMPYESLSDFLDPSCPEHTVEGFPAPLRVAVKARR